MTLRLQSVEPQRPVQGHLVADRQGGLPSSEQVSKLLSQEDFALFTDVYRTLTAENLDAQVEESYRAICSRSR